MSILGRPQDMFSTVYCYTIATCLCSMDTKHTCFGTQSNGSGCNNKHQFNLEGGGDLVPVGGKVALVYHIHAFTIHVKVLILLKGVLFTRSS